MEYLIAHIGHSGRHNEHVCWWKPDSRGYTICVDKAGRYSEAEATSICHTGECIAVRAQAVEPLALTTPYYRMRNGRLGKLYDGGPHRPVPNESQAWRHLLENRLMCAKATQRPTPMPASKARAVYLDGVPQAAELVMNRPCKLCTKT